ncbi:LuxR family transcriptional regulator [Ruania alba]|uniref:Regulatory protein, luxR family n=1 Tax=Ruania alba TaxID=648782 RepID=A0A1H5KPN5_9MICO|nr:LuxR family transcriptional regulator [Ruania alba]SEE66387.1 regulatory protein, luxR family [Ruania alba]
MPVTGEPDHDDRGTLTSAHALSTRSREVAGASSAGTPSAAADHAPAQQIEQVHQLVRSLHAGRGTLVFGEAGVGKSHLVSRALIGEGYPDEIASPSLPPPPTTPLTTAFEGLVHLLSLTRRPATASEAAVVVRQQLTPASSGRCPPLLRVDGAHLLDDASAAVIAELARRGHLTLVATARPHAAATAPWYNLWHDAILDRLDIHTLPAHEIEGLLTSMLGSPVAPGILHYLWSRSGGNALHLRELAVSLNAAGGLTADRPVRSLTVMPEPAPALLAVATTELADLSENALHALRTLALLGPLTLGTLRDSIDRGTVEGLLQRGLIRTRPAERLPELMVEPAHNLLREALLSTMPHDQRLAILRHATGHGGGGGVLGRQAVLLMLSQGWPLGYPTIRGAVAEAFSHHRPDEVVSLVDAAFGPTGSNRLSTIETISLLLDRAEAHRLLSDADAALDDIAALLPQLRGAVAAAPTDARLPTLVLTAARLRADLEQHDQDDLDAALSSLAEANQWMSELPVPEHADGPRVELEVSRLRHLGYAGRHRDARTRSLTLLNEIGDPRLVLPLVYPTGMGLLQAGQFDDAWSIAARYRSAISAGSDARGEAADELAALQVLAHLAAGEIDELEALAPTRFDSPRAGARWLDVHVGAGLTAAARGAWSRAQHRLRKGRDHRDLLAPPGIDAYARAVEALAAAAGGERVQAQELLTSIRSMPRSQTAVLSGELRLLRLDTMLWLRSPSLPQAARALASWARLSGLARIEMEALHRSLLLDLRSAHLPYDGVLDRIRQLRQDLASPRASALAAHAEALADADTDLAGIAERDLNERGLWLPPGPRSHGLTPREREVAALARARLTSRTIATRLGVSSRTVDSHLASVFAKLGVSSREELTYALR